MALDAAVLNSQSIFSVYTAFNCRWCGAVCGDWGRLRNSINASNVRKLLFSSFLVMKDKLITVLYRFKENISAMNKHAHRPARTYALNLISESMRLLFFIVNSFVRLLRDTKAMKLCCRIIWIKYSMAQDSFRVNKENSELKALKFQIENSSAIIDWCSKRLYYLLFA